MRILAAAALSLSMAAAVQATPMDDRSAAMEILQQQVAVERVFSNCRYIRGERADDLAKAWREDNLDFLQAAKRVVDNQGGMTEARRKILDGMAGTTTQAESESREACKKYFEKVRKGEFDLATRLPMQFLRRVVDTKRIEAPSTYWVVEQRRLPTGVLAYSARPWDGDGDMVDCDATAAAKGHIWNRTRFTNAGEIEKDPDPDLWMSECVASEVDPVTGKELPPAAEQRRS